MKRTLLITVITALMVGLFSFAAFGADKNHVPDGQKAPQMQGQDRPGPGPMFENGKEMDLKLTADQRLKIAKMRKEFMRETLDLRYDLQKKEAELKFLWGDRPLNQGAIEAKTKETIGLRIQLINKKEAMLEKVKGVLTPEQLKIFNEMPHRPNFKGPGPRPHRDGKGPMREE